LSESLTATDRLRQKSAKTRAQKARTLEELRADLEVEQSLSWLLVDVHRLLTKNFEVRVKTLGLTRVQWRVLFALKRAPGADRAMTQTEIADMLEMEKAPLGKILDRLEAGGWIVRKNHPTDRRARLVSATSKIEKYAEELAAAAKATFAQTLQGVRPHEVKELIARLERLKRNLGGADDA
jgi:MarR family transcriptional regulator, transcriptional regulator for hemolysin